MRVLGSVIFLCACSEYNLNEKIISEPGAEPAEEVIVEEFSPVAVAGASTKIKRNSSVMLDGTASYDPDDAQEVLTYAWEITSAPEGSTAYLDNPNLAQPTLNADILGEYVVSLNVTDTTGLVSEYPSATMVSVIPYENLIVELSWDLDGTDLDLHLVAPTGSYYSDLDCFYANPNPDWGILNDRTDNPFLSIDDEGTERREAIDYLQPVDGMYEIYALYYRNLASDYPYVTPHITIYAEGEIIADFDGPRLTSEGNLWYVGTLDWSTLIFEMRSDIYTHVDMGGPEYD